MSSTLPRWRRPAAIALAAGTALLSGLALAAYSGREIFPFGGDTLAFSEPHDRAAIALLTQQRKADLEGAAAETLHSLRLAPYDNSARLRLAFIRLQQSGKLDARSIALLTESYDLAPIDHTTAPWRVRFALEHWGDVTPQIRSAVKDEVMTFGRTTSRDADVRAALRNVQNPEGRIAASLWQRELQR